MMKIKNRLTKKTIVEIDDDGTFRYLDISENARTYPAKVDIELDQEDPDAPGSTS